MTDRWAQLRELVREGDARGIAAAVIDLDDVDRRALVTPLEEFGRSARHRDSDAVERQYRGGLTLAACGVLPSAAMVAPWFHRYGLTCGVTGSPPVRCSVNDLVVDVVRARRVPWSGDLARRLAEHSNGYVDTVPALCAVAGVDLPIADPFVRAWLEDHRSADLRALDPRWDAVLLRVFEVDGLGRMLEFGVGTRAGHGLGAAVAAFTADGRFDRAQVLDLCLAALQRGGSPGDARGYLGVYTALSPDLSEVVGRLWDYPSLLLGHSTVAGMAQAELFRVDDAGSLPFPLLVDACRSVFSRTEKKLLRAQLDRVRTHLGRGPVDDLLLTVTPLFNHTSADLAERALDTAIAHVSAASAKTRGVLAAAAVDLPTDLSARAAEAFGATLFTTLFAGPSAVPERPPVVPVSSPAELVERLAELDAGRPGRVDPVLLEVVLDGLVTWSYRDRAALSTALGHNGEIDRELRRTSNEHDELALAVVAATMPSQADPDAPFPVPETFNGEPGWRAKVEQVHARSPHRRLTQASFLLRRLGEVAVGVVHAPRPFLLATPTSSGGLLDPEVLLERLVRAAAGGWEPWPRDLDQALLRLPAVPPSVAERARAIGTAAGTRLAEWSGDLVEALAPRRLGDYYNLGLGNDFLDCWSAALPAHRDAVAKRLLPKLRDLAHTSSDVSSVLITLAGADGPLGEAGLEAFALGLNAKSATDQAAAVEALLLLAGRGDLHGGAFGERVGTLVGRGDVMPTRIVPRLHDLAGAGAESYTWSVVAGALPTLLALDRPPPALADLLALGADLAAKLRATTSVPLLADVAAKRGSSRVVAEARRLAAALIR